MKVEAGLIYIANHLFAIAVFEGNRCMKYLYNENIVQDIIDGNNNLGDLQVPEYLGEIILNCDRKEWEYFSKYDGDIRYEKLKIYEIEELMKISMSLVEKIKKLNERLL